MSRFKIGQRVVGLGTSNNGEIIGGEIYVVDGFTCCSKCGRPSIYIKGLTAMANNECNKPVGCGCIYIGREAWDEVSFAPLTSLSDAIEYRLKVSEPELEALRVKEVSLQ